MTVDRAVQLQIVMVTIFSVTHVLTPNHDSTYIKGNDIHIYFINKINTDTKSIFSFFCYLQL